MSKLETCLLIIKKLLVKQNAVNFLLRTCLIKHFTSVVYTLGKKDSAKNIICFDLNFFKKLNRFLTVHILSNCFVTI